MSESHLQSEKHLTIRGKRRKIPLQLMLLRILFKYPGKILPRLMAAYAYRLWFRTYRHTPPQRETNLLRKSAFHTVKSGRHVIRVYTWGSGPIILLVHGWNGRGCQLGQFVEPLLQQGYRVVSFDAPGHGNSTGDATTLFEIADALHAVARWFGPVENIIAHSFGVTVSAYAIRHGLDVSNLVAISPPATINGLLDKFSRALGLPVTVQRLLRDKFEKDFGNTIWQTASTAEIVKTLSVPGLIVHDQQDYDVPWQEAKTIHDNWRDSELYLTSQLGHRRILRSQNVIQRIVNYIDTR